MGTKHDAPIFLQVLDDLKRRYQDIPEKQWWPDRLFHFTDVKNAVNILSSGYLYSRDRATVSGFMVNDNASPSVIGQSRSAVRQYVRFYFRPKTPTQFHNEGIRPRGELKLDGAQCPVPIFFLFDSRALLIQDYSSFTYGNLASGHTEIFSTGEQFRSMPFDEVYHTGYFASEDRERIVYHRNAEVLILDQVSLEHLVSIFCRSAAERETLINSLPPYVRNQWMDKIRVDTASRLYNKRWTFIETVNMTDQEILMQINPGDITGYYHAWLKIIEKKTGIIYTWENVQYKPHKVLSFPLVNLKFPEAYDVSFYLDGHLVYFGCYVREENVPF